MIWKCICVIVWAIVTAVSATMVFISIIFPIISSFWLGLLFSFSMCLLTAVFFWTFIHIMLVELKIDLLQKTNRRLNKNNLRNFKIIIKLTEKLKRKEV